MSTNNQNKQNPLKPVIAGAALGAVVAAGAVIMTDKKKRKQVIDTMKDKTNHIMHHAKAKVDELRENVEDLREDAENMLEDADKIKKKLS